MDNGEARSAQGTVREWVKITAVMRVKQFIPALGAGSQIGQNQGGFSAAQLTGFDIKGLISNRGEGFLLN